MRQTPKIFVPALMAFALVALVATIATVPAHAGGEKCAKEEKAAMAKAKHDAKLEKAAHHQKVLAMKQAGWTGMETEKDDWGAHHVSWVQAGSPAAEAGVRVGDRVVSYQGVELTEANYAAVKAAKKGLHVGSTVTYTIERDGERKELRMALVEVPDDVVARWMGEQPTGEAVASVDG